MTSRAQKIRGAKPAPAKRSKLSFFGEVVGELRKARWPTRQEALRLSMIVLIVCAVVGAILGGLDYGFTRLFAGFFLGS
jgi:preprotein translocase subunit SecE